MKIIIVGAGEVGYHFAEWLAREKKEVVVIDISPEAPLGAPGKIT